MNATKKGEELGAVLRSRRAGKLNLAAEVRAADAKCAKWPGENREAVWAAKTVVRTKGEAPSVAVCELNVANLIVLWRDSGGYGVIRDLSF